jgi:hypothetical protein
MIKMTNKARDAARSLAVSYEAFEDARRLESDSGIRTWGDILLRAQEQTGIELYDPSLIQIWINNANACWKDESK